MLLTHERLQEYISFLNGFVQSQINEIIVSLWFIDYSMNCIYPHRRLKLGFLFQNLREFTKPQAEVKSLNDPMKAFFKIPFRQNNTFNQIGPVVQLHREGCGGGVWDVRSTEFKERVGGTPRRESLKTFCRGCPHSWMRRAELKPQNHYE